MAHPGQALVGLVAHLVHVRDRVPGPGVAPFQFDRLAALLLGLRVVAGFLQPERMHAEQRVVARDRLAPRGQHARDAIPQHARVAAEEVDLVPDLQRQRVARIRDADILEHAARRAPAAFGEQAYRFDVAAFALGGDEARRRPRGNRVPPAGPAARCRADAGKPSARGPAPSAAPRPAPRRRWRPGRRCSSGTDAWQSRSGPGLRPWRRSLAGRRNRAGSWERSSKWVWVVTQWPVTNRMQYLRHRSAQRPWPRRRRVLPIRRLAATRPERGRCRWMPCPTC